MSRASGGVHDVEGRGLRFEHAKTVVMFGGKDDIFHACHLCLTCPIVGVETGGEEGFRQIVDIAVADDPATRRPSNG